MIVSINVDAPERIAQIPIDNTYAPASQKVIFEKTITLDAGQVPEVVCQVEFNNIYTYTIGVGRYVLRTVNGVDSFIFPAVMANLSPTEHHEVLNFNMYDEQLIVTEPTTVRYQVKAYAVASYASAGNYLEVVPNYGKMQVVVHQRL